MIVPANGMKASAVDAPMRLWLRIRRRASARVHQMSANQTMTPKTTSGTTRLSEISAARTVCVDPMDREG